LSNGVADEEVGRLEMGVGKANADFAAGADFEISDFGFAIGDGGEVVAADEKLIFKGVCVAGKLCDGAAGDGFNFSGKFGSAGAENSGVV
jgi:hypothetical protein